MEYLFGCITFLILYFELIMHLSRYVNATFQFPSVFGFFKTLLTIFYVIVPSYDYAGVQYYMQKFTTYIVNLMKKEKLFASQGGPIILSQASIVVLLVVD